MMLWIAIFALAIILVLAGIFYLSSRICKFACINKITRNKKRRWKFLIGFGVIVLLGIVEVIAMDGTNMAVCMVHLAVFWGICDICQYIIVKIVKREPKIYIAGICAIVITVIYMGVGCYNAFNVWQTHYTVKTDKNIGNIRIVQIADSHVGTTFDGKGFGKHMDTIQKTNPDLVLITGDFVDDDTSKQDMIDSCKALGRLKTTYGVYFSFGNHDKGYYDESYRGYNGDDLIKELEKNNVTVLQDENVLIDDRIYIVGRQDYSEVEKGGTRADMDELVKKLDTDKYIVVMDHQPHDYDNQEKAGVDMVLSGHTHGGQFFPVNNAGVWIGANDKTYGREKRTDTNFIVTSGISDWALKFKTGCKSEYVVIDVEQNK